MITPLDLGSVHLPDWHPRAGDGTCLIQAFVIDHPDGLILVDSGVGFGNEVIDQLYRPATVSIIDALNESGFDERDVETIILTHLHFDHCGQHAALPSATVHVQATEVAAAKVELYTVGEWAHIAPERCRIVDGDAQIATDVSVVATPGHTPGHQSVAITSAPGRTEVIVGQCCYDADEFAAGYVADSDLHEPHFAKVGAESLARLRTFEPAVAYFSHDPRPYTR